MIKKITLTSTSSSIEINCARYGACQIYLIPSNEKRCYYLHQCVIVNINRYCYSKCICVVLFTLSNDCRDKWVNPNAQIGVKLKHDFDIKSYIFLHIKLVSSFHSPFLLLLLSFPILVSRLCCVSRMLMLHFIVLVITSTLQ